ncbi:hypothetical protein BEL04_19635 [Mucilaginibacter sp. PPCGB 2223]|uniref:hypothetical protein n=1 Tax=Mucilaginibacter sp. PPCGB 2223 TaxID=1886027 RepID=UPI00082662AB|nr:hypothetical protein [Mucilaginibacter sp. PPCGB 2223]OCX50935.1 hypothetical protein BEL04_19635 [Mucilaginibacter sp. PPCGB 2223]
MQILLKIYYFTLFVSLDILLYLRLGRGVLRTEFWLKIAVGALVVAFIIHLPFLHVPYLAKFKDFATMCGMVIQLLVVYSIGIFATRRMQRRTTLPEVVKKYALGWLNVVFNHIIFFFFMFGHLIWALALP